MNEQQKKCAQLCLEAAETDSMAFPKIVSQLIGAGFESYEINYRRSTASYYLPSGDNIELPLSSHDEGIAPSFDTFAMQAAIKEAQEGSPGYTYKGFCQKVKAAGCAGYLVSFLGARTVYFGRTGETYVQPFP